MKLKNIFALIQKNLRTYTMIFALIFIWVLFGLLTRTKGSGILGTFFSPTNISNLFRQMTIISFLAIGMVLVIVTGNIDLSVGSVTGFCSVVAAYLQVSVFNKLLTSYGMTQPMLGITSTILTIIGTLIVGLLVGFFQGYFVAYLRIPAFIVTLGGLMIFRGGVLTVTGSKSIVPIEESFKLISQGYISKDISIIIAVIVIIIIYISFLWNRIQRKKYGFKLAPLYLDLLKASGFTAVILAYVIYMNQYHGIQIPVLLMAIFALIITYLAQNTRFGRYAYAIGGNKEASRLSGIKIKWNVLLVFVLIGVLCAVAGLVLTARVAAGIISAGKDYELQAIASCVIGGTSLMGGEGTIGGALVGSLIMASLLNGMSVMNMPYDWQYYINGAVLVLAVWLDVVTKRTK